MKNHFEVYFDCNATTPTHQLAADAALAAMQTQFGNPSSAHSSGLLAKELLENARTAACKVLHAHSDEIIFNSGATEGIQTCIFSAFQALLHKEIKSKGNKALYSAIEHKAVPQALEHWNHSLRAEARVVSLPVSESGQLNLEVLRQEVRDAFLLCTMAVNNETGVIQNLAAIEKIIQEENPHILWLVDCVQALGKITLHLEHSRIDYAVFSGHKLYAAKGVGILYAKRGVPFSPLIVGGGQEGAKRSGTENLPGVAAFGAILKNMLNPKNLFCSHEELNLHRQHIVGALRDAFPQIVFNTAFECSVPTTLNFSVPGLASKDLLDVFDAAGVRISAGSACSAKNAQPSYVLEAMGLPRWRCEAAARLSFGPGTRAEEIQRGCTLIRQAGAALQSSCLIPQNHSENAYAQTKTGIEFAQLRSQNRNSWVMADHDARRCCVFSLWSDHLDKVLQFIKCQKLILDYAFVTDELLAECKKNSEFIVSHLNSGKVISPRTVDVLLPGVEWGPYLFKFFQVDPTKYGVAVENKSSHELLYVMAQEAEKLSKEDTVNLSGLENGLLCAPEETSFFAPRVSCFLEQSTKAAPGVGRGAKSECERRVHETYTSEPSEDATRANTSGCLSKWENVNCSSSAVCLTVDDIPSWLCQDYLCIDVRERHEFEVSEAWAMAGLERAGIKKNPVNIPLSHFVGYAAELMRATEQKPILLYCRSGNRSQLAADYLKALGIEDVSWLKGGVAFFECAGEQELDFVI